MRTPGITTEPRGLTDTQSRPADLFTTAAGSGRSAVLDVCVTSDAAAARGDAAKAAFDRKSLHYRREIQTCVPKTSCIVSWFGQQMVGHTQQSPRTLLHAADTHRAATDSKNISKSLPAQMEA